MKFGQYTVGTRYEKSLLNEAKEDIGFRTMNKELKKMDSSLEKLIGTLRSRNIRFGMELAKELEPKSGREMSEAILQIISSISEAQKAIGLVKIFQDRAVILQKPKK